MSKLILSLIQKLILFLKKWHLNKDSISIISKPIIPHIAGSENRAKQIFKQHPTI